MKTFIVLVATSLLLVSACATTYVPVQGEVKQDFDSAKSRCQNDPDVVNAMSTATTPWGAAATQMYFRACMREQGWVPQR
jgi:hypothetical protein